MAITHTVTTCQIIFKGILDQHYTVCLATNATGGERKFEMWRAVKRRELPHRVIPRPLSQTNHHKGGRAKIFAKIRAAESAER